MPRQTACIKFELTPGHIRGCVGKVLLMVEIHNQLEDSVLELLTYTGANLEGDGVSQVRLQPDVHSV